MPDAERDRQAHSGDVIWSETYDRAWGDILAVQDDIAGNVVKSLRVNVR